MVDRTQYDEGKLTPEDIRRLALQDAEDESRETLEAGSAIVEALLGFRTKTSYEGWSHGYLLLDLSGDVVAVVTWHREATAPRGSYWTVDYVDEDFRPRVRVYARVYA